MSNQWRLCKRCDGRKKIGSGLNQRPCPECRGRGVFPPDHLIPLQKAMEEALAAMPNVDEVAGFCRNQPCLCSLMKDPSYPPPCIPCRCRRYSDAFDAYVKATRPPASAQGAQT